MEHFLKNITIDNFKSIKHLELQGCNRINLFIGAPNVGKSNILDALSLFSLHNFYFQKGSVDYKSYLRFQNIPELYYLGNIEDKLEIISDKVTAEIIYDNSNFSIYVYSTITKGSYRISFDNNLNLKSTGLSSEDKIDLPVVKKYVFKEHDYGNKILNSSLTLTTPNGENIFSLLEFNSKIRNSLSTILKRYKSKLIFDKVTKDLRIVVDSNNEEYFFTIPYTSIADTLQRFIFHVAAIKSNHNSILLFEEPEAQCYPPYIKELTQEIVDSTTNQFFIATHSDIVVNHFLENAFDETTIYMVDFKDGQTVVQSLTEQQKLDIVNDGIDIFFNRDYFLTSNN